MEKIEKIKKFKKTEISIFWPVQNDFFTILRKSFLSTIFENFRNLQKSIKSDVFDTNGPRERDFHEEAVAIDTGEADFRPTATHFMTFFRFVFFCPKIPPPPCLHVCVYWIPSTKYH